MTIPAMVIESHTTLTNLLQGIVEAPPVPVAGITADSRRVREGDVFLACRGATHHGLAFVDRAVSAGAAAIVWDSSTADAAVPEAAVPMIGIAGLAGRVGEIANRFFDRPSERIEVAGVTGTNGKSTVAWLLAQCMRRIGSGCAYIGTLGAGLGDALDSSEGLTTPPCIELHEAMAAFRARGAGYLALEVSSHALQQNRVDGVKFSSALFTNLSRDHIDYHGDMRTYGATKAGFVLRADIDRHIINVDSSFGRELAARCGGNLTVVSTVDVQPQAASFVRLRVIARDEGGTTVQVVSPWGEASFRLPIVGQFNVSNAALVLAQLLCWDVPLGRAARAMSALTPPPGRMQRVSAAPPGPAVYVDYAHTPAGLEAVLQSLRPHCTGKLWCVFGCGGDRDRGKRPLMGKTVSALADRAIVTNDNPRGESPGEIIASVLAGMDESALAIEDRASAIAFAIAGAADEDVVLIAGKGHEQFQLIGSQRVPFSDYDVARACLESRGESGSGER